MPVSNFKTNGPDPVQAALPTPTPDIQRARVALAGENRNQAQTDVVWSRLAVDLGTAADEDALAPMMRALLRL